MKAMQAVFWVVVALVYGGFAGFHFHQIGAHLNPIPEFRLESGMVMSIDGREVGMWDPVRDSIYETNVRISQLNANNDQTNRATAIGYVITAVVALACGCFTLRETRRSP